MKRLDRFISPSGARLASVIAIGLLSTTFGSQTWADSHESQSWQGRARDAWLDGRIETAFALNRYLNPFEIDTQVDDGAVKLSGTVDSQIDKELAGEIAKGVDGVREVDNQLAVDPDRADSARQPSPDRSFGQRVEDATITARVKVALLSSPSTEGLAIDVDTERAVVTLAGEVRSAQERELAERIAENTEGVERVANTLEVGSS